jgi:hypothetical protein
MGVIRVATEQRMADLLGIMYIDKQRGPVRGRRDKEP